MKSFSQLIKENGDAIHQQGAQFAKEIETMIKSILPDCILQVKFTSNLLDNIIINFAAKPFEVTIQNDPYWIMIFVYGKDRRDFEEPYNTDYSGGYSKRTGVQFRRIKNANKNQIMTNLKVYFTRIKEAISKNKDS